jgi:hypothetical protein
MVKNFRGEEEQKGREKGERGKERERERGGLK